MLQAMLFDLDGVLRRYTPGEAARVEARHGLPPGQLRHHAFHPDVAHPAVRGEVDRATWIQRAGERLGHLPAMRDYLALGGHLAHEVLDLVRELRGHLTVGLLTNATDTLPAEPELLGLTDQLDVVFNSSAIGAMKPDRAIYEHCLEALQLPAHVVGFTDDQPANAHAASALGLRGLPFVDAPTLRAQLRALGLPL